MNWNLGHRQTVISLAATVSVSLLLVIFAPYMAVGQGTRSSPQRLPTRAADPEKPGEPAHSPDLGAAEWLNQERIIFVSNEINPELAERVIAQLLYLDAHGAGQEIYLYINSPGGDVTAGLAIYDVMRSLRSDVVTVTLGEASSMAGLLLAGGTKGKRFALPNARIMIHQPMSGVGGQASDIAIEAKEIVYLKNKLNQILATHTGQSLQRISTDTDRDFYLSAQEAKAYGLVDQVVQRLPSASNPTRP